MILDRASSSWARSPPAAPPRAVPAGKSILVLGGTGFLGPHVVTAALARGHTVTLFNRGKTHAELFPEVEKLHGDRDGHLEALATRTWDAVVDPSGYVPRIVKASAELLAPRVGHYGSSRRSRSTPGSARSIPTSRCRSRPSPIAVDDRRSARQRRARDDRGRRPALGALEASRRAAHHHQRRAAGA